MSILLRRVMRLPGKDMKNKIIYLSVAVGLLVISFVFIRAEQQTQTPRYHQHLEQPSEADLEPCNVCDGKTGLCTHLPIIRIETGGQKIPGAAILNDEYMPIGYESGDNGEEQIAVAFSTIEAEDTWHHVDDGAEHQATAMIRYRGNSSRSFSKHNFAIKLVEDNDLLKNRNLPLLGMESDHEWALHGPFLDKTLIRNYMWMNISAEVMGYAPAVRFCELVLDGEYQGVYVLMETISEGDHRVNLTDYEPGDIVCSYMYRIGSELNPLKLIDPFMLYTLRLEEYREVEVLYPATQYQTKQVHDYISADISEIERLLYSSHMNDYSGLYQDYLDVDSFVNYYIIQEFLAVNDMFSKSTYFYKDVRGKMHIGPVWDYNNVLDNFFAPVNMDEFLLSQRGWYSQLMQDEVFVNKVIARYRELRKDILSEERLNTYLDDTVNWLGSAVNRNYEVWGYTFDLTGLSRIEYRRPPSDGNQPVVDSATPEEAEEFLRNQARPYNPKNFEEAIEWMRTTMNDRGAWMDAHIESLRQYCADSKNAARIID